jgi:adenylate cyclase
MRHTVNRLWHAVLEYVAHWAQARLERAQTPQAVDLASDHRGEPDPEPERAPEPDPQPEPAPEPEPVAEARAQPGQPAVAVLAFTNLAGDIDQEYLSDGIAEDIATQLSHSTTLFVATCKASFRYKGQANGVQQIGHELGVRHLLQGTVRREGVLVRISAELVEAETGNKVWSKRFERVMADLFDVQDEIADAVAVAIDPAISPAERRLISSKPIVSYRAMQHVSYRAM